MKTYVFFLLFFVSLSVVLRADKNTVPRFVSLRSNEVNLRVGPGANYPVEWIYTKAGLPVEVIAEFDNWRKIRDWEGTEGWVHKSMLCAKRHGIIQGGEALIYSKEDTRTLPLVRLQQGVVVEILKCHEQWCQIRISDFKGSIQRSFLWGLYAGESLN